MEKEQFDKLSITEKWDIIKFHMGFMYSATHTRMTMLPMISAISAALLVIVTFNGLLDLDWIIRMSLCFLLLLVPISLFLHNYDLKAFEQGQKATIEKLVDGKIPIKRPWIDGWMGKITDLFPDLAIFIITIIISVIILKIICR